jgi:hypothetical protein
MNTHTKGKPKQELYVFRGKEFFCDAQTITQLNYALALNRSRERYVLKKDYEKNNEC